MLTRRWVWIFIAISIPVLFLISRPEIRKKSLELYRSAYSSILSQNGLLDMPRVMSVTDPEIPAKILEASSKKLKIKVIPVKSQVPNFLLRRVISEGTGFCVVRNKDKNSKIILTAKHIVFHEQMPEPLAGTPFSTSSDGLITFGPYQYLVFAIYNGRSYKLAQTGVGRYRTEEDFIAFQPMEAENDIPVVELQKNVTLGEKVYTSGITTITSFENPSVIIDVIDTPFAGILHTIIEKGAHDAIRLNKLYRITSKAAPGFSGGPVYNERGEVIGISLAVLIGLNFTHVASAYDLELFIDSLMLIK